MDKHVVLKDVGVREGLAAGGADKWPLVGVGSLMAQSPTVIDVGAVAVAAGEFPIPGVHHLVTFELAGGEEAGRTESARVTI